MFFLISFITPWQANENFQCSEEVVRLLPHGQQHMHFWGKNSMKTLYMFNCAAFDLLQRQCA